jgi:hypothetical protein
MAEKKHTVTVSVYEDADKTYEATVADGQRLFSGTSNEGDLFVGVETVAEPPQLIRRLCIHARNTWKHVEFKEDE